MLSETRRPKLLKLAVRPLQSLLLPAQIGINNTSRPKFFRGLPVFRRKCQKLRQTEIVQLKNALPFSGLFAA